MKRPTNGDDSLLWDDWTTYLETLVVSAHAASTGKVTQFGKDVAKAMIRDAAVEIIEGREAEK